MRPLCIVQCCSAHTSAPRHSMFYMDLNVYIEQARIPKEHANSKLQSKNPRMPQSPSPATDVGSIRADFHARLMACGMSSPGKRWLKTRRTSHLLFNIPHIHGHLWPNPEYLPAHVSRGSRGSYMDRAIPWVWARCSHHGVPVLNIVPLKEGDGRIHRHPRSGACGHVM